MSKKHDYILNNVEQKLCFDSLDYIYSRDGLDQAQDLIGALQSRLNQLSGNQPSTKRINTPYMNTIHPDDEPEYPGDIELENKIAQYHSREKA